MLLVSGFNLFQLLLDSSHHEIDGKIYSFMMTELRSGFLTLIIQWQSPRMIGQWISETDLLLGSKSPSFYFLLCVLLDEEKV